MPRERMKLGTFGNKKTVQFEKGTEYLQLVDTDGCVIGSIEVRTARELAQNDGRWKVAVAMYDYHVDIGKIIA